MCPLPRQLTTARASLCGGGSSADAGRPQRVTSRAKLTPMETLALLQRNKGDQVGLTRWRSLWQRMAPADASFLLGTGTPV